MRQVGSHNILLDIDVILVVLRQDMENPKNFGRKAKILKKW